MNYHFILFDIYSVYYLLKFAEPVINSALEEISTTNSTVHVGYTVDVNDIFDSFVFSILEEDDSSITKPKGDTDREVIFQNLQAGTLYTVKAITASRDEESFPKLLEIVTGETLVLFHLSYFVSHTFEAISNHL